MVMKQELKDYIVSAEMLDDPTLNFELLEEYPFLKIYYDIPQDEEPGCFTHMDEIPLGWRKAFGAQMMDEIKAAATEDGSIDILEIYQFKEKYGELRTECNCYSRLLESVLNYWEEVSSRTCIYCGKPAKYLTRGWIEPVCDDHLSNSDRDAGRYYEI